MNARSVVAIILALGAVGVLFMPIVGAFIQAAPATDEQLEQWQIVVGLVLGALSAYINGNGGNNG